MGYPFAFPNQVIRISVFPNYTCHCFFSPPCSHQVPCRLVPSMALKRKFDSALDDVESNKAKQLKLIPFPNMDYSDSDVAMSDVEPFYPDLHHIRTNSSVSSTSSASISPLIGTPTHAAFDLYPLPYFNDEDSVITDSQSYSHFEPQQTKVRLLQPSTSLKHHGTSCSQIPKLRVACAAGPGGQRTMWSFCEECGAISMVDAD